MNDGNQLAGQHLVDGGLSMDLHAPLLLQLNQEQRVLTGMIHGLTAEFRAHAMDTRNRLRKLEDTQGLKRRLGLRDVLAFGRMLVPWLLPILAMIRATLGQVSWAEVLDTLSKLLSAGTH